MLSITLMVQDTISLGFFFWELYRRYVRKTFWFKRKSVVWLTSHHAGTFKRILNRCREELMRVINGCSKPSQRQAQRWRPTNLAASSSFFISQSFDPLITSCLRSSWVANCPPRVAPVWLWTETEIMGIVLWAGQRKFHEIPFRKYRKLIPIKSLYGIKPPVCDFFPQLRPGRHKGLLNGPLLDFQASMLHNDCWEKFW